MKKVYLDYAATNPVDQRVVKAMELFWNQQFANPNSLHGKGRQARKVIEKSRQLVAKFLNCQAREIIFTSGATEANNLALKGTVRAWQKQNPQKTPHLIVSSVEHHCVLDSAKALEKQGAEISWLKADKYGLVDPEEVKRLIKENTVLVSVMYGNNEMGTIEPIKEIGEKINSFRGKNKFPIFHTDAVQAIQYLDCEVKKLVVDFLSASAHKFYGPKGVGFLFVKKGTPIIRQQDGGSQEFNLRAGTENVPGIVGLAKALELVKLNKEKEKKRLTELRDYLIKQVLKKIPRSQLTGHPKKRLAHIASFVIPGVEGEAMLLHLDDQGIAASSGSACTSGTLEPSHVLLAMGIRSELAHGSLRFSLGKETTKQEIDYLLKVLPPIVSHLRKMAPKLKV